MSETKFLPGYPKIFHLGAPHTEPIFTGDVIIQEKVDGSQFGFGINEIGDLHMRSKGAYIDTEAPPKMFLPIVEYLLGVGAETIKQQLGNNTVVFGEYLEKPKHNVLNYDRIPSNHLVVFDIYHYDTGVFCERSVIEEIAANLGFEVVPELHRGHANVNVIKELLTTPSFLGRETIEGVVVKNYGQMIDLFGRVMPLIAKFVREAFKEQHNSEWKTKSPKLFLEDYFRGFKTEARWQKAIQHLREADELENSPRDIGKLIALIQTDIIDEEKESIGLYLYNWFIKDILRESIKGFPEWYKAMLLENMEKG